MKERLQKVLARAGIGSRRAAEEYIAAGRVMVDGCPVTRMGLQVDPELQQITFDGHPLSFPEEKVTVLLNKPAGYVTTMHDPQGRPLVGSLVKEPGLRLFPVGRLDLETEGALLLTNDGDLANRILHPRYEIKRTYQATVQGLPAASDLQSLRRGIELEGRRTWPAEIRTLRRRDGDCTLEVIIHEGRKRQVRKMFAAIGHPVLRLKRVAYGGLRLGDLASGAYRRLDPEDIRRIFQGGPAPG
ncbi:MAG TPA: rRNA pseudouridine synthase [Desulfurivibrio alkaliphilus]|uniref:Pseudouridine synthase n=1 Tax=Desulfurivibrio alkaliphilus TaxID=427923 RepID=A0A7C2TFJ9_9BACT|nr:rRNA pseudouridine synthase [Desulfurivibrio alkaliphilus]